MTRSEQKTRGKPHTNYIMVLRMFAWNALAAAMIFLANREGWVKAVVEADTVYISRIIVGLGAVGLSMITVRIFSVSRELNIARKYHGIIKENTKDEADTWLESTHSRSAKFVYNYRRAHAEDKAILVEQLRMTMGSKLYIFGAISEWLVVLGLIGTVVGMRMGTGVIDPEAFRDLNLVVPLLKKVLAAFYVAFDTTIVGACMALWLDVNLKWILRPGTAQLINEAVEIGVLYE